MAEQRGGSGNFAQDREKASEAGKKVDSKAAVISKMIRSALLKQAKRGVSIAMVVDVNLTTLNSSHY